MTLTQLALRLGALDQKENEHFPTAEIQFDYPPFSKSLAVQIPAYDAKGLTVIISKSLLTACCALMVIRKSDIASGILFANCLARLLQPNTPLNTTLKLPENSPEDLRLEDADPDFFCDRFLVADPTEFGFQLGLDSGVKLLVGSDDNTEGELSGKSLLEAVALRTALGISPPGIPQPQNLPNQLAPKVVLRSKK